MAKTESTMSCLQILDYSLRLIFIFSIFSHSIRPIFANYAFFRLEWLLVSEILAKGSKEKLGRKNGRIIKKIPKSPLK